jgi:D-amino-acid oxidase
MRERIVVVGAGIIGITSALELRTAGFDVDIVCRELPEDTTSAIAAAFWFPYKVSPPERTQAWGDETYQEYLRQIEQGIPGLKVIQITELSRNELPEPPWASTVADFRRITGSELPAGFTSALAFSTVLADTTDYLPYLRDRVESAGVRLVVDDLATLEPLQHEYPIVVNCSGVGARDLVGDALVYPIRGQLKRVHPPSNSLDEILVYVEPDKATYIVPRARDCILGGTAEKDDWELAARAETATDIVRRCEMLEAGVSQWPSIQDVVGLRPGRDEVRLELERVGGQNAVIHNYGHGGAGFTLCWGCAQEVTRLVKDHLSLDG